MNIPADSGGGGTYWGDRSLPDMWALIKDIDTNKLHKQADGWRNAKDLAETNWSRMESFKSALIEKWPPDKSEASKAYVAKIDELIISIKDVYEKSLANATSASNMAYAIKEAQDKIRPLANTYQQNMTKLEQTTDDRTAQHLGQSNGTLTGSTRDAMSSLSTDLILSSNKMQEPASYQPPKINNSGDDGHTTGDYTSHGGGSPQMTSPVIPAPVLIPPVGSATPPPVLQGTTPPVQTPIPTTPISQLPTTTPGGPVGVPPVGTPISGGIIGKQQPTGPIAGGSPMRPGGGPAMSPTGIASGGRPSPMGPGGVIGGAPGARGATAGAAGMRGGGPMGPGGVIGGAQGGRGGAGVPGVRGGQPGMMGGAGAPGARKSADGEHENEWDPDNPWEVAEGVAPVVEAPREHGPIDPGPAIGGRW